MGATARTDRQTDGQTDGRTLLVSASSARPKDFVSGNGILIVEIGSFVLTQNSPVMLFLCHVQIEGIWINVSTLTRQDYSRDNGRVDPQLTVIIYVDE